MTNKNIHSYKSRQMRKWFNSLLRIILVFFLLAIQSVNAKAVTVNELAKLPEEQIDIGTVSLTLAKEIFPTINIPYFSEMIDVMVADIVALTKSSTDPDYRIRALNTYLYRVWGMSYDLSDPNAKNLENRFIHGILANKKGSCVNMPILYLAVAQRLGYPVYPVSVPGHSFLRYDDPNFKKQNIEATSGGGYSPDEEYIDVLQISDYAIKKGTYLKKLTYREYLGLLIEENGIYWGRRKDLDRAIKYLEIAIKLNPRLETSFHALGILHKQKARAMAEIFTPQMLTNQMISISNYYFRKAFDLGFTQRLPGNYLEQQRKAQAKYRNQP